MKEFAKKVWYYVLWPYRKIKEELEFRKRLKEMRKRDPHIY